MNNLGGLMRARSGVRPLATDRFDEEGPMSKSASDMTASAAPEPNQPQGKWLQIAAAAASTIGGLFSQRSANKQAEKERKASEAFAREQSMRDRTRDLQDRRYKEDAAGGYAGFYEGPEIANRPQKTDIAATLAAENAAYEAANPKKPTNKKKKKKGLLGKLVSGFL